ncbi:MAG: Integral rane sensor signal transduction histidine kinase, partial [Chthoniobacteraceae bacterium]|nr:Integral rane sensor signal transduction histidine kinase [Chthoniobacteraceae bacterium]
MFSPNPRVTLFLLLGLALVIFAGGLRLARREENVRLDRDREALRRFAEEAQTELRRLEELYETYLTRLARTSSTDAINIRREADRIVGVRQFSVLQRGAALAAGEIHVRINATSLERIPLPMFAAPRTGSSHDSVLLDETQFFAEDAPGNGWINEPGKPLMFWLRRPSDEVALLLIDTQAVEKAISAWLKKWASAGFESVRSAAGPDQFRNGKQALATVGEPPDVRPDLLLPLRSRLGAWELSSWDRHEVRVHYDTLTKSASSVVAMLVAVVGFIVHNQQQRTSILAAQRVSFVNHVSHELRSPLTNILLNVDLAAEAAEERPREARHRLGLVQEEARRLGRLIDNVLAFSRHEQGKLYTEPRACIPANVITAVVEQYTPSFARRALTVRSYGNAGSTCLLDADAFAQILSNLLSNVEKYVPGGTVEIAAALTDDVLTLTVCDDGPGIPPAAAERIFRPFERLHSQVNEGASGTGLGLSIARDLATIMNGSLTLLPSERGARFQLRLPAPPLLPITSVA